MSLTMMLQIKKFPVVIPRDISLDLLKKYTTILFEYRGMYGILQLEARLSAISILEDHQKLSSQKCGPPKIRWDWANVVLVPADIIAAESTHVQVQGK